MTKSTSKNLKNIVIIYIGLLFLSPLLMVVLLLPALLLYLIFPQSIEVISEDTLNIVWLIILFCIDFYIVYYGNPEKEAERIKRFLLYYFGSLLILSFAFAIISIIVLLPLYFIFPEINEIIAEVPSFENGPQGIWESLFFYLIALIGVACYLIPVYLVYYRNPKEDVKAIKEFDSSLIPPIGKTFTGEVVGVFNFTVNTEDDKFYTGSKLTKAKSATITYKGDHVIVEGIISVSGTLEHHDYIVASSTKTLSYEGVGMLHIDNNPHNAPYRSGREITYLQPKLESVNIKCNTEEDAISLWNGLMDVWLKERIK